MRSWQLRTKVDGGGERNRKRNTEALRTSLNKSGNQSLRRVCWAAGPRCNCKYYLDCPHHSKPSEMLKVSLFAE